MAQTVFFSWQADTPTRVGRNFLKGVLDEVCKGIASDTTVAEALRDLAVDSDTQGVAGQPPIVETIFKKIDASGVFVADMTLVGKRLGGSSAPNPNVLIEYGWALRSLKHERVICVMNTAFGEPTIESLPFDLRHVRWPIQYELPDDAVADVKAREKRKLVNCLTEAIRASLATVPSPAIEPPTKFQEMEPKDGRARFRNSGEALGFEDDRFPRLGRGSLRPLPIQRDRSRLPHDLFTGEPSFRGQREVVARWDPRTYEPGSTSSDGSLLRARE